MDITDSCQVCTHLSQSNGTGKKMQHISYCKMPVFPILGAENCYAIIYLIKCDWVPFVLDTAHFTASSEQQLPELRHPKNETISRHQDIFTEEQLHACVRLLKLARLMAFTVRTPCLYLFDQLNVILYQRVPGTSISSHWFTFHGSFFKFCILFFFLPIDLLLSTYSSGAYWSVFT